MERNLPDARQSAFSRREFLQRTSRALMGAAAALALGPDALAEIAARNTGLRVLGRTGLKVTPISFGGIQTTDRRLLDIAIDLGINLFHTAPGYTGGNSIRVFGEVMKEKRDKIILAVKVRPHRVDDALRMLNTDTIDIAIPDHGPVAGPPFPDDALREAYEAARQAGKIRFTGFSTHANQGAVVAAAAATGYFDVMLVAYNVTNRDLLAPIIRQARERHNTGFLVMKSAGGLDRSDATLFAAGLKDILSSRDVDSILLGMGNVQQVQQNAALMRQSMTRRERDLLQAHLRRTLAGACMLCAFCGGVCPKGIAVADIMRCRYYAERGDLELARETYRELPETAMATACDDCGACTRACPKHLSVAERVREMHATLS